VIPITSLARFMPSALVLPLLALLAGGALGTWGGYTQGRAPLQTELAQLRESHSQAARLAAQASGQRLQQAQARSETLAEVLLTQINTNNQLTQEKTRALKTATAGRACLSDRALRLLNESPGITVASPGPLPTPGPGAAAPGATVATDTDLAGWIAAAGNAHEQCRARLGALIAFHAVNTHHTQSPQSAQSAAP
jgi:hypothetical protein